MSQQATVGHGAGRSSGRGPIYYCPQGGGAEPTKDFKSVISKIPLGTFNMGKNKFAAQFTQSCKNIANYLQCTASSEGYLVAETVRMGSQQIIALLPAINESVADVEDQMMIRAEEVKTVVKR